MQPYLLKPNTKVFIPYIFMEWSHISHNLDGNCPDLDDLVQLFVESGYEPWDVVRSKLLEATSKDFIFH